MKTVILATTLAAALLAPAVSQAQQKAQPLPAGSFIFSPMLGFAATFGGKTLARVEYADGGTQDIKSGGTAYFYGGAEMRFIDTPFALQGTVGYHYDTTAANNGDVTFSRVPFEVVGMFEPVERFRFGAGVHFDTSVHLSASGAGDFPENHRKYDNAAGVVAKFEFMAMRELGIELSYVNISYKENQRGGVPVSGQPSVDASHVGVGLNYHF